MNSSGAVAFTAVCLLVVNLIVAVAVPARLEESMVVACNIASGAAAAMTIVLFRTGPGNLFPIAIIIGAVIITVSSVAGALVAAVLTSAVSRFRSRR